MFSSFSPVFPMIWYIFNPQELLDVLAFVQSRLQITTPPGQGWRVIQKLEVEVESYLINWVVEWKLKFRNCNGRIRKLGVEVKNTNIPDGMKEHHRVAHQSVPHLRGRNGRVVVTAPGSLFYQLYSVC